jgi:hypothetical protein
MHLLGGARDTHLCTHRLPHTREPPSTLAPHSGPYAPLRIAPRRARGPAGWGAEVQRAQHHRQGDYAAPACSKDPVNHTLHDDALGTRVGAQQQHQQQHQRCCTLCRCTQLHVLSRALVRACRAAPRAERSAARSQAARRRAPRAGTARPARHRAPPATRSSQRLGTSGGRAGVDGRGAQRRGGGGPPRRLSTTSDEAGTTWNSIVRCGQSCEEVFPIKKQK